MKIEIDCNSFKKALSQLKTISPKRTTYPTLCNVLLEASEDNQLTMHVTDTNYAVSITLTCDVIKPGKGCLDTAILAEYTSKLSGETVVVEIEENYWGQVSCGKDYSRIVGVNPLDFASLPSDEGLDYHPLGGEVFLDMIRKTEFCATGDSTSDKQQFSGIVFKYTPDLRFQAIGTNTTRLCKYLTKSQEFSPKEGCSYPPALEHGIICPKPVLLFLLKYGDIKGFPLSFALNRDYIFFKNGPLHLSSKLIQAMPVNYSSGLRRYEKDIAKVKRADLLNALKLVSPFLNEVERLVITVEPNKLNLYTQNPNRGESTKDIDAEFSGEKCSFAINQKHLTEVVEHIDGDTVAISVETNRANPCVIQDPEMPDVYYLIMLFLS